MSTQPQPVHPAYRPGSNFASCSSSRRFMLTLAALVLVTLGMILLGIGTFGFIALLMEGSGFSFMMILLALLAMLLLYALWQAVLGYTARYRFEETGLKVRYLLHKPFIIPWHQFQAVGIYFSNTDPRYLDRTSPILLCVMKGEKPNHRGHWRLSSPFHVKRIITMPYTPSLYAGLQEKCTIPVSDLRVPYLMIHDPDED